jgi:acyl-CoA thioesterase FadM
VRLQREIHAEGWVTEVRRRLITTAGRIVDTATDEVLATAEATYVAAPEARKRELKKRYGYRPLDGERRP